MYINIDKTLRMIGQCLSQDGSAGIAQLRKMYELTLRLQSQLLAVIYDKEMFSATASQEGEALSRQHSSGRNEKAVVTLTICEPLPSMKYLTEALEEHWKAMIHAAIFDAARQEPLPHFEKAFVEIEITTTKGSSNSRLWDTSNRAINVIINNLKGIFFEDDNMEHMAFSVVGRWGETGATVIRISEFYEHSL